MRLTLIPFSSDRFTYYKSDKTITAEVSDLNNYQFERIYDDACDVGIAIRSVRSGAVVTYGLSKTIKIHEGTEDEEVGGWEFTPISEDVRRHPACEGTKVIIWND